MGHTRCHQFHGDPRARAYLLSLTSERLDALGCHSWRQNSSRHETASLPIEAREGVTTGISAADRAKTVAVAVDAAKGRRTLRPTARPRGGVLVAVIPRLP